MEGTNEFAATSKSSISGLKLQFLLEPSKYWNTPQCWFDHAENGSAVPKWSFTHGRIWSNSTAGSHTQAAGRRVTLVACIGYQKSTCTREYVVLLGKMVFVLASSMHFLNGEKEMVLLLLVNYLSPNLLIKYFYKLLITFILCVALFWIVVFLPHLLHIVTLLHN